MVIVTMTSFPKRIHLVPVAFEHFITTQTCKADKYVLWLSRAEFNGEKTPDEIGLGNLVNLGVEIHWCDEDSKIHIRHNSLKSWPQDYNFIIDEDFAYPETYMEEMLKVSKKHPGTVINYFRIYEYFNGYRKHDFPGFPWASSYNKFNGGLVLFPPNTFPNSAFKYECIRDLICPFHDETWVNLFLSYEGGKVYGLHRKNWKKLISFEEDVPSLKNTHSKKNGKYTFDVIQFNRVLCVFPELRKIYKKKSFGLYCFSDKEEIASYEQYGIIDII